jgi:hypothetical protein
VNLTYFKIYFCAMLIAAVIVSPLSHSLLAIVLLSCQLYLFWKRPLPLIALSLELLCVVLMPLTLNAVLPAYLSTLLVLPALPIINRALAVTTTSQLFDPFVDNIGISTVLKQIMVSLGLILLLSLITATYILSFTVAVLAIFLAMMVFYAYRMLSHPLNWQQDVELRLVAGDSKPLSIEIKNTTGRSLFMRVVGVEPWVRVIEQEFSLSGGHLIEASVEPPLSGPSSVLLNVSIRDWLGLLQFGFVVDCAKLIVIPRATYSKWLASKYLEQGIGNMSGSALSLAVTSLSGPKGSGIEYHSSHMYSPGDNLNHIDWKHTSRFRELVVKKFQAMYGNAAVIMVNLTASSEDEADRITSNLVNSVLTLAQSSVNAALVAYNRREVVELTTIMSPNVLLRRVLQLIENVNLVQPSVRYLWPPDARKLEITRKQLANVDLKSAKKLLYLLDIESEAIKEYTSEHPLSIALSQISNVIAPPAMMIPITAFNHDAEVLSLLLPKLEKRGYRVFPVSIDNAAADRIGITLA